MSNTELKQRLAAILAADVSGYSRLMSLDERATVAALDTARKVFRAHVESSQGRVIDMAGDSVLAVFETAIGAVSAALAVQAELGKPGADVRDVSRMRFRIGVHLGDVIEKADGTVYGDGVNIAARLEGLSEPGGVTVSESIRTAVKGKVNAEFEDQGEQQVKNIADPVRTYAVKAVVDTLLAITGVDVSQPVAGFDSRPAIAVLPFANLTGDPDQEYFADGLAEDILTRLAMQRWLPVIARNSSFAYRGRTIDVKAVGRMLGARYDSRHSVDRQWYSTWQGVCLRPAYVLTCLARATSFGLAKVASKPCFLVCEFLVRYVDGRRGPRSTLARSIAQSRSMMFHGW